MGQHLVIMSYSGSQLRGSTITGQRIVESKREPRRLSQLKMPFGQAGLQREGLTRTALCSNQIPNSNVAASG